jgi:beta-lactam-binding protein with PASTA domain
VHLTGPGSCTITASQPGDANYNAAPNVSRTFSIAHAPCTVPQVIGKTLVAAKDAIAKRHCRTGPVTHTYSRARKNGIVISQSRRPGKVLPAASKIGLVVSRGPR